MRKIPASLEAFANGKPLRHTLAQTVGIVSRHNKNITLKRCKEWDYDRDLGQQMKVFTPVSSFLSDWVNPEPPASISHLLKGN
ncbi:hypothetical protein L596_006510 [Steinernema carpocapsae]|uniref:Uncharacterized protein n=1 Tax=Steinernema carpocapsae TaxID=34508 RepID=A0A4U8V9F1_STECR|nr:hypothetical protein L596_006510 [Steinernema carpocapsae]